MWLGSCKHIQIVVFSLKMSEKPNPAMQTKKQHLLVSFIENYTKKMAKCSTCICKNVTHKCVWKWIQLASCFYIRFHLSDDYWSWFLSFGCFQSISLNVRACSFTDSRLRNVVHIYISYTCKMCSHWIILIGLMSFTVHFQQSPAVHNLDYALHIGFVVVRCLNMNALNTMVA